MNESIVVLTYGPSGVGKTTDMGYSFPTALFAAAPGALNSVYSVCGYKPATTQIGTIEDATKLLKEVAGNYDTLVIDDFSFMAEQTFAKLDKKYEGFKLWGRLRDVVLEFRNQARYSGVNVVMNAWEQFPKTRATGFVRGGPMLSGRLPEQMPAMCDLVMRATHDAKRHPWPSVYRCHLDPNWAMKDRLDIASKIDPCPMNLGELLRASGAEVARHPDLPDQEALVEEMASVFQGMPNPVAKANEFFKQLKDSGMAIPAVRWALRDALDRAEIRKALVQAESMFIDTNNMALL
jgi:hypothetical protein